MATAVLGKNRIDSCLHITLYGKDFQCIQTVGKYGWFQHDDNDSGISLLSIEVTQKY